jgi:hypothetical protein
MAETPIRLRDLTSFTPQTRLPRPAGRAVASGQWGPFVGKAWRYQRTADANTGMSGEEGRGHLTNGRTSTKGGEGIYT